MHFKFSNQPKYYYILYFLVLLRFKLDHTIKYIFKNTKIIDHFYLFFYFNDISPKIAWQLDNYAHI